MIRFMTKISWAFLVCLVLAPSAGANNLKITNVSLEDRSQAATTAVVEFDITWDNSWRNTTNHDAAWVVLKIKNASYSYLCHGNLKVAGLNPAGTSAGSNSDLELYIPTDKTGVFIRRKSTGSGTVTSQNVRLVLDYNTMNGTLVQCVTAAITATTSIQAKVVGVEMVFIPTGPFDVGDSGASDSAFWYSYGGGARPWHIDSEGTITSTASSTAAWYYTQVPTTVPGDNFVGGTGGTINASALFPKGYAASYSMKYEITEGLYVDFINSLDGATQRGTHDVTCSGTGKKATTAVATRNTISESTACSGAVVTTTRPDRGMGYLSWPNVAAILDWLALRPMTEFEYEKMARGPVSAVSGEFAWGTADTMRTLFAFDSSPELGNELASTNVGANTNMGTPTLSQGDNFQGSGHQYGPVRVGMFATSSSTTRLTSGAGYYGNMDLTGNLWEYVVPYGVSFTAAGALYTGVHGDGELSSTAYATGGTSGIGYWPGFTTSSGIWLITGASLIGLRGGSFDTNFGNSMHRGRISDRYYAGLGTLYNRPDFGGRGVRTYDGTDF